MKQTHTPGPWTTWNDGIRASNGEQVATVHAVDADHSKRYGSGPSDANARLIARAPEMRAFVARVARQGCGCSSRALRENEPECDSCDARALLAAIDGTEA